MKNLSLFSLTVKFSLETVKEKKTEDIDIITLLKKKYSWALRIHWLTFVNVNALDNFTKSFWALKIKYGIVILFSQIH